MELKTQPLIELELIFQFKLIVTFNNNVISILKN